MTSADPPAHATVLVDAEGVIRHWSDGAERLFGYRSRETEGQSLDVILPDAFRPSHGKAYRRAMTTGMSRVDPSMLLHRPVKCRDGTVRSFTARLFFMHDPRNRAVGAAMVFVEEDE